jgi:predicted AAA+ superfamily ATPase
MQDTRFERLFSPPRSSFFLFGLRGVGKSTLAKELFPDALRIDLLDERLYHTLLADPARFALLLGAARAASWVVVDEIQRLPNLLNEVHRAIEDKRLRFVLLGSSARKLKAAGTNLLAGRALKKELFPLTPHEMGTAFDLNQALATGTLPLIVASEDREESLRAYVETYLKEEIRAEALVRNLPGFVRFLPVAALFHGQVVNTSNIARGAEVSRTTVQGYFEILEDTLLVGRLPAYRAKLRVRERVHPKLYWIDAGIVRAARGMLGPVGAEERGALFEGYVLNLLRAYHAKKRIFDEISYWSPAEAIEAEVDFLLRRGKRFVAIEVKSTPRYSNGLLKGLRAIASLAGLERRILVYNGREKLRSVDGIDVLPFGDFARQLHAGKV